MAMISCLSGFECSLPCGGHAGREAATEEALAALEPALEGLEVDAVYVDALISSDQGASCGTTLVLPLSLMPVWL